MRYRLRREYTLAGPCGVLTPGQIVQSDWPGFDVLLASGYLEPLETAVVESMEVATAPAAETPEDRVVVERRPRGRRRKG